MRRALVTLSVVVLSTAAVLCGKSVYALTSCPTTEVIGVRGSGQQYGESKELLAVKQQLPATVKFTELSNQIPVLRDLSDYQATAVAGGGGLNGTGLGALAISRLDMGAYRKSVESGKSLLKSYITSQQGVSTCLVLVGYSQGAQVVNESIRELFKADRNLLNNVIYIGLFGDPLYNPFGFDPPNKPAWIRGTALYPFYGSLYDDFGLPGIPQPDYIPRSPDNPRTPFTKVGSWCNYGDLVCATDITHSIMQDGHATYAGVSAQEMASEIKLAILYPDQNVTSAIRPSSICGAPKQDLVVLLDTSDYMRRNKDLFTKDINLMATTASGSGMKIYRTFGNQLLDSGCGDKRVAIVGFDSSGTKLLLDFTNKASDIDSLMDSLYQPSSGGTVKLPKLREAAILGMQQRWRDDASRTLFAIAPVVGDGPFLSPHIPYYSRSWSMDVIHYYMGDSVGQQFIALSRSTRAAFLAVYNLPIDLSGFTLPPTNPSSYVSREYVNVLSSLTGGYNWQKEFYQYLSPDSVKNLDYIDEIKQFEMLRDGTRVSMHTVQAKVGQPVELTFDDTSNLFASSIMRGEGVPGIGSSQWYVNCDALQDSGGAASMSGAFRIDGIKLRYTPKSAGTCTAAVLLTAQHTGNGCYDGCPEPFPPYMLRMIPFTIDVKPADYVDKIPGNIASVTKTIFDNKVEFSWEPPSYNGDNLTYLVKVGDGSIAETTTFNQVTLTDTAGQDSNVYIQALGEDGRSAVYDTATSGATMQVIDMRTPSEPPVVQDNNPVTEPGGSDAGPTKPFLSSGASIDEHKTSAKNLLSALTVQSMAPPLGAQVDVLDTITEQGTLAAPAEDTPRVLGDATISGDAGNRPSTPLNRVPIASSAEPFKWFSVALAIIIGLVLLRPKGTKHRS